MPDPTVPVPADDLTAPIAEGSYEWYRREVERLRGERDSLAEMLEQLPDSHVKLGDVAQAGGDQCVPWCPACCRQRAEQAEAELAEAKRVIAAQPKPSAVEELRETIAEILDNSDETAVDAFLYFAAAEVARIAGGEMTARWQAVAERDAAHATLLHFAAEAHRRKWAHEGVNPAAFDALHRLGNELHAALDAPSAPESQETTDGHA